MQLCARDPVSSPNLQQAIMYSVRQRNSQRMISSVRPSSSVRRPRSRRAVRPDSRLVSRYSSHYATSEPAQLADDVTDKTLFAQYKEALTEDGADGEDEHEPSKEDLQLRIEMLTEDVSTLQSEVTDLETQLSSRFKYRPLSMILSASSVRPNDPKSAENAFNIPLHKTRPSIWSTTTPVAAQS